MPLFSFEGKSPRIHPSAFIAPTAVIIGDVIIEENASVWYNAVIRGDFSQIIIEKGANVQDNSVVHGTPMHPVTVGAGATIGHLATVHGATLGKECMIANGATVLDGAKIGARTMVAAGALVPPDTEFPDEVIAVGVPAKIRGPLVGTPAEQWVTLNPEFYQQLARRHIEGMAPILDEASTRTQGA
jgi:carbonic anhydrase/acetyltransferase-like protein (isoleucine patch superfamily)